MPDKKETSPNSIYDPIKMEELDDRETDNQGRLETFAETEENPSYDQNSRTIYITDVLDRWDER